MEIGMRKIACAAALVLAVLGLGAQEKTVPIVAGQVDVEAEAWSPLALAPAGSVASLDADQIEGSGATTASDLVQRLPGALSNRYGPDSAQAFAIIRGSKGNQVLVVVDGLRVNDAQTGGFDLSLIPASSIERIQVLSGSAGAVYGADAVAGVVVVTTKRAEAGSFVVSGENTSYPTALAQGGAASLADSQSLRLDTALALGPAQLAIGAEGERGAGKYPYGSDALRQNSDFMGGSGKLAAGMARASFSSAYREIGTPGSLSNASLSDRQKDSSIEGNLAWSSDALSGGSMSLDLLGYGSWKRADARESSYPNLYDQSRAGFELRDRLSLAPWLDLGSGLSLSQERADSTAFDADPAGQPSRLSVGGYLEPTILLGERLKLVPALRYDWNDNYAAGFSAMLSAVWKASSGTDLRLSAGRSFRAPTFLDLYTPFTDYGIFGTYSGNPNLKPELGWTGELGLDTRSESFSLSSSLFARYIEDLIASNGQLVGGTMINIGRVFTPGAELKLDYRLGPATMGASYTFVYPLDLSGGKTIGDGVVLEDVSQHNAKAYLDFESGRVDAGLDARYWSGHFDAYYRSTVAGALVLDARIGYKVKEKLRLGLAAENLLDRKYQVIGDYPMPGLSIKTSLRIEL
jgi:outer membrane cobalamin receptor